MLNDNFNIVMHDFSKTLGIANVDWSQSQSWEILFEDNEYKFIFEKHGNYLFIIMLLEFNTTIISKKIYQFLQLCHDFNNNFIIKVCKFDDMHVGLVNSQNIENISIQSIENAINTFSNLYKQV